MCNSILSDSNTFVKKEAEDTYFCGYCRSENRMYQYIGKPYYTCPEEITRDSISYCKDCGDGSILDCDFCREDLEEVAYFGTGKEEGVVLCNSCHSKESEAA